MLTDELLPCRECGKPCQVEDFVGPEVVGSLWLCCDHKQLGGHCTDPNMYMTAEAWNTRQPAAKPDQVEAVARAIYAASYKSLTGKDPDPDDQCGEGYHEEAQAAIAAMQPVVTDARIERLESACWQVLAYDQMLRSISGPDTLFAGDRPDVDAVYDAMVKAVTASLGAKP